MKNLTWNWVQRQKYLSCYMMSRQMMSSRTWTIHRCRDQFMWVRSTSVREWNMRWEDWNLTLWYVRSWTVCGRNSKLFKLKKMKKLKILWRSMLKLNLRRIKSWKRSLQSRLLWLRSLKTHNRLNFWMISWRRSKRNARLSFKRNQQRVKIQSRINITN